METPHKIIGMPLAGRLEWIGVSAHKQSKITELQTATLFVGQGITEDYHAKNGTSKRQVTLIQEEHLIAVASLLGKSSVHPVQTRRNISVSGINLLILIGRRFRIGTTILEGTGTCDPCKRIEETLGRGGLAAMAGHGGITAIVIQEGTISIGDAVELVEESSS